MSIGHDHPLRIAARESIAAAESSRHSRVSPDSIIIPEARNRLWEMFEREQGPGQVRMTLQGALTGDMRAFYALCLAMIDSWPKLQANLAEVARLVTIWPWKVVPYAERGQKPNQAAEKFAREIEAIIWNMKPEMARRQKGLEGTIKDLVFAYYLGHGVSEIQWEHAADGIWKPRCTTAVPSHFYGYPYDGEDRLMLDREGLGFTGAMEDFPANKFLTAINQGHPGHPAVAAPLRALANYWLAAVMGLKWFAQFTETFGIPFRHVKVANPNDMDAVARSMERSGPRGYMVSDKDCSIDFHAAGSLGGAPQKDMIELADRQCDVFILGQTLTSGTDKSGSRALGEVHEETKNGVIDGVADFVGEVLTYQLVPAIVNVNWGPHDDMPQIWAKREKAKDLKAEAERIAAVLNDVGIAESETGIAEQDVYDALGIRIPGKGEKLFVPKKKEPLPMTDQNGAQGDPATGVSGFSPHETKDGEEGDEEGGKKAVAAADASLTWKRFPKESGTLGIPRSEMPQIASGSRGAMVSFLRARGIGSRPEEVPAAALKPTQAEYSPEKVAAAGEFKGGNRSILISEEGHVVDGHHQWMAAAKDGGRIKVTRLMAPIHRVLMMAHRIEKRSPEQGSV